MTRNKTIDFFKFIFSIGIIAIHVSFMKNVTPQLYDFTANGLFRLGVPFYFVVSGYYFYGKVKKGQDTKGYINKLVKLFFIFTLIETTIYFIIRMYLLNSPWAIFTFIFTSLTIGQGGIYWYMSSLILSLIILRPMWKKKQIKPLFVLGVILYLITATNDAYGGLFANTFIQNIAKVNTYLFRWPQAGLMSSIMYLSIGAMLYENEPQMKHLNTKLVISLIILLVESYLFPKLGAYDFNCYVSLIFAVPLLFLFIKNNDFIKFETKRLGLMSTYMYMCHPLVIIFLRGSVPYMNQSNELLFFSTVLLTSLISYYLTRKKVI